MSGIESVRKEARVDSKGIGWLRALVLVGAGVLVIALALFIAGQVTPAAELPAETGAAAGSALPIESARESRLRAIEECCSHFGLSQSEMEVLAGYGPAVGVETSREQRLQAIEECCGHFGLSQSEMELLAGFGPTAGAESVREQRLQAVEECCGHFGLSPAEMEELAGYGPGAGE